jgi:alpha-glucosidase
MPTADLSLPLLAASLAVAAGGLPARAEVPRLTVASGGAYLVVEVLDDDLVHFELSGLLPVAGGARPIPVSPQVAKADYPGPARLRRSGRGGAVLETAEVRVAVDPATLCLALTRRPGPATPSGEHSRSDPDPGGPSAEARAQPVPGPAPQPRAATPGADPGLSHPDLPLATLCPFNLTEDWKGLTIAPGPMEHVYGLGEQFIEAGEPNGDWTGRVRTPGDEHGNQMVAFDGGHIGNVQVPVMYALGPRQATYALFLDHLYKQRWDFTGDPWRVETRGEAIRGYLLAGPDLADVRRDYLELTGRPPVPPKKMFGLWVSEWGYDDWQEVEDKLATLRANRFPIDGFLLDLQWDGGVQRDSDASPMGRLVWDTERFPDPAARLRQYRERHAIGVMPIEQSYVARALPEHADLAARGFLVRAGCATCPPVYLDGVSDKNTGNWWGKGGMLDWTLDAAADHWHDTKREALVAAGVAGHWIDLGEPEMYDAIDSPGDPADWAAGVGPGQHAHGDWHNAYNLKWAEGIGRGYRRNAVARRPFVLSRSGAAGIQRHGAALWSGDIGPNLPSLAAHLNAQLHLSLSGIDYFGADVGGFYRGELRGPAFDDLYTRWLAHSAWLDVPVRPHTENLCNCRETAPDRVGDRASNLANLRERYALVPYLYSLAHRAWLAGEPVFPPLVYQYPDDPNVREMGDEKLIGRDLLVATATEPGATHRDVYLPAGEWVDYWTGEWLRSRGERFAGRPLRQDGRFRLPVFARAGAILPRMAVDGETMNVLGQRLDGTTRDELVVRVYASPAPTELTLYEDDGETVAYQQGAVRSTRLSQDLDPDGQRATVTVAGALGTYAGAPAARDRVIELVVDGRRATGVTVNDRTLAQHAGPAEIEAGSPGWHNAPGNRVLARCGPRPVAEPTTFVIDLEAHPAPGARRSRE